LKEIKEESSVDKKQQQSTWARLIRKVYGVDPLFCERGLYFFRRNSAQIHPKWQFSRNKMNFYKNECFFLYRTVKEYYNLAEFGSIWVSRV